MGTLQIYEGKDTGSDVVGTLGKGGVCYVLNDQDPSWYYVESGVVRGFVRIRIFLTGAEADAYVAEKGETNLAVATLPRSRWKTVPTPIRKPPSAALWSETVCSLYHRRRKCP